MPLQSNAPKFHVFATILLALFVSTACGDMWSLESPYDQSLCDPACSGDKSACYEGECVQCVGTYLGGNTCKSIGYDGGDLKCKAGSNNFDTSGCYKCGDKTKNGSEECDGSDFGSLTCWTLTGKSYDAGSLSCSATCKIEAPIQLL